MTYQELQKEYPDKEIKLVPKENELIYTGYGYKTVLEFVESAFGVEWKYCFMVET